MPTCDLVMRHFNLLLTSTPVLILLHGSNEARHKLSIRPSGLNAVFENDSAISTSIPSRLALTLLLIPLPFLCLASSSLLSFIVLPLLQALILSSHHTCTSLTSTKFNVSLYCHCLICWAFLPFYVFMSK